MVKQLKNMHFRQGKRAKSGFVLLALCLTAMIASCSKKEMPTASATSPKMTAISGRMTIMKDSNLVDSSYAAYLASYYNSDVFFHQEKSKTTRRIISAYSVPDKYGDAAMYVFNYDNDEGYVIISADFRYQPILMFGEVGNLNKTDKVPSMFGSWFGRMVENVEGLRDGLYDNTRVGYDGWSSLMDGTHGGPPPYDPGYWVPADNGSGDYGGGSGCTPLNTTVGPYLSTSWGQDCGYNSYTPLCSEGGGCGGHDPTGCVATAMAQIIRYWAHPDSHNYNYSNMPNTYGNTTVAHLMSDAGLSVDMHYTCTESGADAEDIDNALKDDFDFAAAEYDDYDDDDFQTVVNNLDAGKPVILRGCTEQSHVFWIEWGGTGNCHAWVCDGYRMQGDSCDPQLWYHMNWGMNTPGINTWAFIDDWNPLNWTRHWNYGRGFVHNIHP